MEVELPTSQIPIDVSPSNVTESHLTSIEVPINFTKPMPSEIYAKPKEQAL